MPVIKIEPLEFKTQSGHSAMITGINTGQSNPLAGYVHLPTGERYEGLWRLDGKTSDDLFSLTENAIQSLDFDSLRETAIHLLPQKIRNQAGFA